MLKMKIGTINQCPNNESDATMALKTPQFATTISILEQEAITRRREEESSTYFIITPLASSTMRNM